MTVKEKLFRKVFDEKEYDDFLKIIEGKENQISNIDKSAINNFDHNILGLCDTDLFESLYQHFKFYFEQKKEYTPKMQEGLALCISKAIIIDEYSPFRIDNYFCIGDKFNGSDKLNPFEEISRLLLIAVKNERYSNNFGEIVNMLKTSSDLEEESKLFLDIASTSLNELELRKRINRFSREDVISDICSDLEHSNIDSTDPMSATKKENRIVLVTQFERIYNLYNSRIEHRILVGDLVGTDFSDKLLTRFNNRIVYSKRNIGMYEKTKTLVK